MTETQRLLRDIGWSGADLRRRSGVGIRAAHDWAMGRREPPEEIVAWLRDVARWLADHPAPRAPRRRRSAQHSSKGVGNE